MLPKRLFVITAVFLTVIFTLIGLLQTVFSAPLATTLLYDSTLGTTPDQQNFSYVSFPPGFAQASQIYSAPVTVLDTSSQLTDYAGYTVTQTAMPTLDRADGFQLTFALRVISENHDGDNDRAGFSIILLSEDLVGVELAFWEDEIWVQEGNGNLFVHAEGVPYVTTSALTTYELTVISNTYLLKANEVPLLSGTLRQYTDWNSGGLADPYEQPNQLFLGDNTSSAGAEVWLGDVSIIQDEDAIYELFLPYINKP